MLLPPLGTLAATTWLAVMVSPSLLNWPIELMLLFGALNGLLGSFPMVSYPDLIPRLLVKLHPPAVAHSSLFMV